MASDKINGHIQATGNVGPAILGALVNAGFDVTVLQRQGSKSSVPDSVKAVAVDYESIDSLATALKGQDALVSALPISPSKVLIDATIRAGVKRFIPSEYSVDALNTKSETLPVYKDRIDNAKYLQEVASGKGFTFTRIVTGTFLDWCVELGFYLDWRKHQIELVDGGDKPVTATNLADVGQAVVGTLRHLDETKNRAVFTQSAVITQKKLLGIFQKLTPGQDWEVTQADSEDLEKFARAEMEKEHPNFFLGPFNFFKRATYGEGYGGFVPPEKLDNNLLGVREMSDVDLEAMVARILGQNADK